MKHIKSLNAKNITFSLLRAILLIGIAYIILLPLLVKFSTSIMSIRDFMNPSVKWIPRNLTFEHYLRVWEHMGYAGKFTNSFLLTLLVSILQLVSCTLVGYGLARFEFEGRGVIFSLVIFTLIVPPQLIVTPMYLNFRFFNIYGLLPGNGVNLIDTYWVFILLASTGMYIKNGLFIYIMRQFFKGMPRELEEAAYIDGAGLFKAFFRVMLPGAIPGLVVVFLFSFVWQWNDYYYLTMFFSGGNFLPMGLEVVADEVSGALDSQQASAIFLGPHMKSIVENTAMIMVIAPLLMLYLFMQRYFIESIQRTGIVG